MNKQIKDFWGFVKKNRVIIYTLLGVALLMQICSKGALPPVRSSEPQVKEITPDVNDNSIPKPDNQNTNRQDRNDFTHILLMVGLILAFFVAKRYGWLDKLFPKIVIFKVEYYRQKSTGNLLLKVFLINKTKTSISFNNPMLIFYNGSKKREFVIKNIGGQSYFPITLTPNTGNRFTIDAQKFYNNVQGLDDYKTIRMVITDNVGKSYKSIKWPTLLTFRKI